LTKENDNCAEKKINPTETIHKLYDFICIMFIYPAKKDTIFFIFHISYLDFVGILSFTLLHKIHPICEVKKISSLK